MHSRLVFPDTTFHQNSKFVEFASDLTVWRVAPSTSGRMCKVPTLFGIIGMVTFSENNTDMVAAADSAGGNFDFLVKSEYTV